MRVLLALVVIVQTSSPAPTFEVASVKVANPDVLQHRGFACGFARGRFYGLGDVRWFVACAYDIPAARSTQDITGFPKWAEELFEIQATFSVKDQARDVSPSDRREMLQSLFADRFKLVVHRERKEVPSYARVMARKDGTLGPQLLPTPKACADWLAGVGQGEQPMLFGDLPCGRGEMRANVMRQSRAPLSQLASLLSPRVGRPVEDRTGLTGMYALDLRWSAEPSPQVSSGAALPSAALPDNLPTSIFTALQEQLGLKLEPTRTLADLLVVDRIERPTPN